MEKNLDSSPDKETCYTLDSKPHWLIQYGITLLLALTLLMIGTCHYIFLPNIMTVDATLVSCSTSYYAPDSSIWHLHLPSYCLEHLFPGQDFTIHIENPFRKTYNGVIVKVSPMQTKGQMICRLTVRSENTNASKIPDIQTDNQPIIKAEIVTDTFRLSDRLFKPFKMLF